VNKNITKIQFKHHNNWKKCFHLPYHANSKLSHIQQNHHFGWDVPI